MEKKKKMKKNAMLNHILRLLGTFYKRVQNPLLIKLWMEDFMVFYDIFLLFTKILRESGSS